MMNKEYVENALYEPKGFLVDVYIHFVVLKSFRTSSVYDSDTTRSGSYVRAERAEWYV